MELRRLRYFSRVAEDGSLTRSAGILRIAQPALSRQMRLLEEELAFDNVRAASLQPVGNLVVGLPPGLAERLALPIAQLLERDFPSLVIRLVEGPMGSVVDWLNRGAVDIAFLEEDSRDSRLEHTAVCDLPLWLVGPASAQLSCRKEISLEEVALLPLVVPSHHMGIKGAIDDAGRLTGLAFNVRLYADAPSLMRRLISTGQGYGILPAAYSHDDIASGLLSGCRIIDPQLKISILLTTRRRGRVNKDKIAAIESELVDLARAHLCNTFPRVKKLSRPSAPPSSS